MKDWHTNLIAMMLVLTLFAKWYSEKRINLSDWTNIIGILSALGFVMSKDSGNAN